MLDDWQGALNVSSVLEVIKDPGSTYTSELSWSVRCHIWGRSRLHACGRWPRFLRGDVLYRKEIGVRVCFWVFPMCMFLNVNSLSCQKILYPRTETVDLSVWPIRIWWMPAWTSVVNKERQTEEKHQKCRLQLEIQGFVLARQPSKEPKHPWSQTVIWALE